MCTKCTTIAFPGEYFFVVDKNQSGDLPDILFTENETNALRLMGHKQSHDGAKDAFHQYVIHGKSRCLYFNHHLQENDVQ